MDNRESLRDVVFAYHTVEEARECRATDIFKFGGNVYAFDSTT